MRNAAITGPTANQRPRPRLIRFIDIASQFTWIAAKLSYINTVPYPPPTYPRSGVSVVIRNDIPFEIHVNPSKAEIHSLDMLLPKVCEVDSRFRGSDCGTYSRRRLL